MTVTGSPGDLVVEISWIANPFRGDKFEEAWAPAAEAAVRYGAHAYAFYRSDVDPLHFTQLAFFRSKLDWERYWYSDEINEARAAASGLYHVPVLPVYQRVVTSGALAEAVDS